ncbi:hypothetical protein [Desulfosporosinus sp. BG]|uniref:hypothetical protein n=1 Tax=Desulfosporosinus sp. BG TaxID=1633135 RepID=UPI00159EFE70|nr:hypothetical protein [Desulfosporosinus sp. BG]
MLITSELKDILSYTDESQNTVIWRTLWSLDLAMYLIVLHFLDRVATTVATAAVIF